MNPIPATRRQMLAGASAALTVGLVPNEASASPQAAGGSQAATKMAADLFTGKPAPALSFAVARGSEVVWTETLGKANLELDVDATPAHTFRLGSVCKVLTSTVAARLVSQGVLDLASPISTWLPDLPQQHRATTMLQLLTHRGGVRHYLPKDFDVNGPGGAIYMRIYPTDRDVLALFVDDPLVAPPGTTVAYSSFGYTLASMVMQAAAGVDFRQLIENEIGRQFALSSLIDEDPWALRPARANGYLGAADLAILYGGVPEAARPKLTGGWANMPLDNPAYCWAGAGFMMTPSDTARFGAAMVDGPNSKISAAERSLLFTPLTEKTPKMPPLGLGWRIDSDTKGRLRWHHEGATPGGRYSLVVYPKSGLSVAIAGNVMVMAVNVGKVSSDLADLFE